MKKSTLIVSLVCLAGIVNADPLLQWIHEDDVVDRFERAALEPHPGVFNIVGRGVLRLSTLLRLAGKRALPLPKALLHPLVRRPDHAPDGDRPAAFFDFLRYLWVADGERGWREFGEPVYTTQEAWMSFVTSRPTRRPR